MAAKKDDSKHGYEPGHTGHVKDPEHDGRLKQNREAGVTLGTTDHTKQAPHVYKPDEA